MTTLISDVKLTQKCQIVLEDISPKLPLPALESNNVTVPTQTVKGKVMSRRRSVRLMSRSYLKVAPTVRVWKKHKNISKKSRDNSTIRNLSKKAIEEKLIDAKQPNDKSFDTMNCNGQLSAESTLDDNNLIAEIKSIIENIQFESFVDNGDFDDELHSLFDSTDSNRNCLPLNSEPLSAEPELSTPEFTSPTDFIPPTASVNEIFRLDEICYLPLDLSKSKVPTTGGELALDLSFSKVESTDLEWNPITPLDLSISKIKSTGPEWKPKVIRYVPLDLSIRSNQLVKNGMLT